MVDSLHSIEIPSHLAFRYRQVWLITEIRNNCIYKTKPIGFIHVDDIPDFNDHSKYVLSSLSTGLIAGSHCILEPYIGKGGAVMTKGYKYDDLQPGDRCPECLEGHMELEGLPGGALELCCDRCGWGEE